MLNKRKNENNDDTVAKKPRLDVWKEVENQGNEFQYSEGELKGQYVESDDKVFYNGMKGLNIRYQLQDGTKVVTKEAYKYANIIKPLHEKRKLHRTHFRINDGSGSLLPADAIIRPIRGTSGTQTRYEAINYPEFELIQLVTLQRKHRPYERYKQNEPFIHEKSPEKEKENHAEDFTTTINMMPLPEIKIPDVSPKESQPLVTEVKVQPLVNHLQEQTGHSDINNTVKPAVTVTKHSIFHHEFLKPITDNRYDNFYSDDFSWY